MMAGELKMVNLGEINDQEYQMRTGGRGEAFDQLVESVRRDGILVPVLLCSSDLGFTVVAGHRRVAAAREIGLSEIPGYVVDRSRAEGWSGAFAENLFRKDLSPVELAAAVVDCLKSEVYDEETLARALGRSVNWIRFQAQVASWPDRLSLAVHTGKLSVAAARHLADIDDNVQRDMLIDYAVENGATARTTAAWFQAWQAGQGHRDPGEIEPVPGRPSVPTIEPWTPCVICGRQQKMIDLRYIPVCCECGEVVVELARKLTPSVPDGPVAG